MGVTRRERLEELFRRLAAAAKPASVDDALDLVCQTLDHVEDDLSGVTKSAPAPPPGFDDGRMYPPDGDNIRRTVGGGIVARARRHRIVIGPNGSIHIWNTETGRLEFQK